MSLVVRPVTAVVGADISGIDLGQPLSDDVRQALLDAVLEYGVLFFRDQDVTPDQHLAFARQMGKIQVPAFAPKYGTNPEMIVLDQTSPRGEGADNWHSDNTFMP